ncbi:MAG: PHP domain-containing protein [Thermoplasmatales archaeon]|nr:PHP domain-containing protein [Thermoplasmatales archaeon]
MKFDMHIHTIYSPDGNENPKDIIKYLKKKGLDGMAIVDHNTLQGAKNAIKISENFLVIPGMEIKTRKGHILAIGIEEEINGKEDIIEEVNEKGGIAIIAHPFRFSRIRINANGIEVMNGRNFPHQNKKAIEYANKKNIPFTAGSDGHYLWEMGKIYIEMDAEKVDDAIEEIMKRRVKVVGENNFFNPFKCKIYSFSSFVKRGFKRVS